MSARLERATRRDLRRAAGEGLVSIVQDHEDRIGQQATAINGHMLQLEWTQKQIGELKDRVKALEAGTLKGRLCRLVARFRR